jgi:hypothetical protein
MYFQKAGLWYRQTGGAASDIDILGGNNPHIGPYDGGNEYINQFNCLIPSFSSVTLIEETVVTGNTNLFTNYNYGLINGILNTEAVATCTINIDWNSIITSETEICYNASISDYVGTINNCYFTVDWYSNIIIDDEVAYTSPVFYSSTGRTDVPAQSDYINALQSGATALDLILVTDSEEAIFTTPESGSCDESDYTDKPFSVSLTLDIDINCPPTT